MTHHDQLAPFYRPNGQPRELTASDYANRVGEYPGKCSALLQQLVCDGLLIGEKHASGIKIYRLADNPPVKSDPEPDGWSRVYQTLPAPELEAAIGAHMLKAAKRAGHRSRLPCFKPHQSQASIE